MVIGYQYQASILLSLCWW